VIYVEELIGRDTVNTMPPETLAAFRDHGQVRGQAVLAEVAAAEELLVALRAAGLDYDDVVETLEREGLAKFNDSFDELIEGIDTKRSELTAR
jgi:transaldolase